MALKIFDTLAPQGDYPAVKAEDVQMPDGGRLSEWEGGISEERLQEALAQLRYDMEYEDIKITGISISPAVAQLGAVLESATVSWTVSREPAEQTVNGEDVGTEVRSHTLTEKHPVTNSWSGTVRVTGEKGEMAQASASVQYYNAVYYSSHWDGALIPTDSQLKAMDQKLQSGRGLTINAEAGDGEYVLYACPARMGNPEFWCNGFQGGFEWIAKVAHFNAQQYREDYNVYVSNAAGLSGVTITVK